MAIGQDIPRVDGLGKLQGTTQYVDDLPIAGVLHGGTVRTPIARGRIKRIVFDPSISWNEYTIVDHRDIPGANGVALIEHDQPALVASEFRHRHEPVLLVAHPSKTALRTALRAIKLEVEPLPALLDPRQPRTPDVIQHHTDNVFKRIDIRKGDPAAAFAQAPHVIEAAYQTGAQEHTYLEPNGMLAYRDAGQLVVCGSLQCPYFVLKSLMYAFGRSAEELRVIQAATGGAFGGKEDYPSILAIHAALLCEKSGRPVKIIYDRQEDMAATTKRHPSWVRHRTAVNNDGRLLAMEIDVLMDGGAYMTLSPVVLSRGVIHAAGPYFCENTHVHGEARLTNSPPYGAFRGFGAPQTFFALERHMDVIAQRLRLDPTELRRRNLLHDGQTMATGQVYRDGVDLSALLDTALQHADYHARRAQYAEQNTKHPYIRRGIGVATFMHGSGFTGGGEAYLASQVLVEGLPDGRIDVLTANTDFGQGTETILAQIAAEALNLPHDAVRVAQPDTARVPNSGPTAASRTVMVVGKLVEQAALDLRRAAGESNNDVRTAIRAWHAAHSGQRLLGRAKYSRPHEIHWSDETYRGDAYAAYSWAAHVADVEVDLRTYAVRVQDYVAVQEVGRVVNPTLATGQVQGGIAQGIGWALLEEVVLEDGAMKNCQMTNYAIPSAADLPPIRVYFEECGSRYGPGGAKGIGEMPMNGPAPAVVNAVCSALGIFAGRVPLTPEHLLECVEDGGRA